MHYLLKATHHSSPHLSLMDAAVQPSDVQNMFAATFLSSVKSRTNKKKQRNQKQRKQIHRNARTKFSFCKPSPTPLLINREPPSQSKSHALNSVITDLESSVDKGINIDICIFSSLLESCFQLGATNQAIRLHHLIPKRILRRNFGLSSKLLRLYASSGRIEEAHQLFDQMSNRNSSAFPWNALISGYNELGLYEDAMAIYFQMEEEGVEPDEFTFPRVLKACGGIGSVRIGQLVHRNAVKLGFSKNGFVLNSLIDMYAKCGDIMKAHKIFHKIKSRDSISWNSILSGYVRHGLIVDALHVFSEMIREGFVPDSVTISTIVSGVPSVRFAHEIHGWVIRHGISSDLSVANSLVSLYSHCNKLDVASCLFDQMPERDVVSWNSIISAHSKDPKALSYFQEMEKAGVLPNSITFVSLLSACANLGLIDNGKRLFSVMGEKYGISAIMEHYACMVNLYGRSGLIDEAYEIITRRMEFEAGATVWGALLYACSIHNNVSIGEIAANQLFELEADNEHNFELLMKIYRNVGRFEDLERVRMIMEERGLDY